MMNCFQRAMKRMCGVFFAVFLMSSCSSVTFLRTDQLNEKFAPLSPESVSVYSTNKTGKDYWVIGEVIAVADAGQNASRSVSLLKKQAANLGADAIINLQLEFSEGYWATGIKATGTAIRFKNNAK